MTKAQVDGPGTRKIQGFSLPDLGSRMPSTLVIFFQQHLQRIRLGLQRTFDNSSIFKH
jgi:hypothetical protein